MSGHVVKDQGPVGLDEEEAKNELELGTDEIKDDVQHGISSSSTDCINPNQASIATYEDRKDIKDDKSADDIERMDIPKDSFSMLYVGNTYANCILPIFVFVLQVTILALILYNML